MTVFGFAGDISSVNSGASSDNPGTSSVNGTIGIFPKEQKGEMQFTYQRQDFSAGGGWRVAGGGWRVRGSGWRVAGGGWRVAGLK